MNQVAKKYFYYQKTQTGQWTPKTGQDNPTMKRGDMTKTPPVQRVILLDPSEYNLTLDQLKEIHPLYQQA